MQISLNFWLFALIDEKINECIESWFQVAMALKYN